ncbi:MAG: undecaprenyl-diphosphate phosphatase [Chlamydiia bacterium]|nr:undecaprenyl-diphosphate phosphatase [Chlamydiia bacterium]
MSWVQVPSIAHFHPKRFPLTPFQSFILGIVQGLTEFFPISSSAHLQLVKALLHIPDGEHLLHFDLFLHTGTLFALMLYLYKEIPPIVRSIRTLSLYALALFPLVPAYFLLKPLRIAASNPAHLGYYLMITASLLFLAAYSKRPMTPSPCRPKWKSVLCIGIVQTIALIPGISRSGSTIATARLLGWDWVSAAKFSFLLAIPAILGGQALEIGRFWHNSANAEALPASCYAIGFLSSFLVGLCSVRLVFWIYERSRIVPLAWYCLLLGTAILWVNPRG